MSFDSKPDPKMIWRYLRPAVERLEALIRDKIRSRVGFTIDPVTARLIDRDCNSWAVSIGGHERKFTEEPSRGALLYDIAKKLLAIVVSDFPLYFGGWPQGGCYYLDLSRLISNRKEAVDFAMANGQVAIFHLRTGKTLYLPPVPPRDQPEPALSP